ncbi:MAG: LptF/LptG family permease [Planctomycetota bacterium]|nr:MAG: LptF/LptG family permease [Planctomycetota bacterium]
MKNPIQIKFLKKIIFLFLLNLIILEAFFVIANLFQLIRKGVPIQQALFILPYVVPYTFPFTIPLSLLLSISIETSIVAEDREILLLESSGISCHYLTKPILYLSLFLCSLSIYINGEIIPYAYEKMKVSIRNGLYAYFLEGKGENQSFEFGHNILFCDGYGKGRFRGIHFFYRQNNQWYQLSAPYGEAMLLGKEKRIFLALYQAKLIELKSLKQVGIIQEFLFPLPISLGSWERKEFKTTKELIQAIYLLKDQLKDLTNFSLKKGKKKIEMQKKLKKDLFETRKTLAERTSFALSVFTVSLLAIGTSLFFQAPHRLIMILINFTVAIFSFYTPFFLFRTLIEQGKISIFLGYSIPHFISFLVVVLFYRFRK